LTATRQANQGMDPMLYVGGFVAVQIFFLLLTLGVASTPWFLTHDAYPGILQAGYSSRLKHADCDIVLYGDSSALTGLDPEVIQTITGLKACNLSEGVTIQGVVGSRFPLDTYLRDNKPPLYLLAMYTPSLFRPYVNKFSDYQPEGVLYMMQYDRTREMLWGFLLRRKWVVDFDLWAGRQIVKDFLDRHLPVRKSNASIDIRAQRDGRNGIWPYPSPPETDCVRAALHQIPSDFARHADSVAMMRSTYGADGTTVLVNISPVATCDTLQQTYRELSDGLHDNPFESLPISDFNEGDVHFSAEGSRHVSVEAANQILLLEERRRAGQSAGGASKTRESSK
jgi:hypothetical protein